MNTRKLYYEDAARCRFTARVTDCQPAEGGFAVRLDATAFYPEGGGQACDLGTINDVRVLDVQQTQGGLIHLCDGPLTPGSTVWGQVDGQRRMDLMQQHTGEHIVSGIISRRYGWHNVGFHVGTDVITIDFDGPIPAEDLPEIEAEANAAVWQNLPVRCWTPSEEELSTVAYRSKKALQWPVRIVQIPGFDSCACCGVHVTHTGQIGLIKLFSCVKFHQGVRLEMACGARALAALNLAYDQNKQVSQAFSVQLPHTGEAARRMNQRLAEEEYRCAGLQRKLRQQLAAGYTGKGNVLHMDPELTPPAVRELADSIAQCCGGTAAVLGGSEGSFSICLVCHDGDVSALGEGLRKELGARGGGRGGIFQGSIPAALPQILDYFVDFYRN